jgi:hypothetical protein
VLAPGQRQQVTGTGFHPGDVVTATQRSAPRDLGTYVVGPAGTVTFSWTLRVDETPGQHTIDVVGAVSGTARATFAVAGPPPAGPAPAGPPPGGPAPGTTGGGGTAGGDGTIPGGVLPATR